ncbi:MAG TPA: biopolymer transporter ExbD [Candidatus Binataceae bacterium]|nr:biopolymer transporter ExbD [Candidatus Binataceae bacterium]
MAINIGSSGGVFSDINITPLTDIFLVLLIIFMVTTSVTIESAAHVDLPKAEAPAANNNPKGVTVAYTSDHKIFVNGIGVAQADLERTLRDDLGKTPDKIVVFQGDQRVILGDMVRILDIAKRAGAEQIAIAAQANGAAPAGDTTGGAK